MRDNKRIEMRCFMFRRNKYFIVDLLANLKEYMIRYNCSLYDAICDLDGPILVSEVKEVNKLMGAPMDNETCERIGRSEKEVRSYEEYEQKCYNYERGDI